MAVPEKTVILKTMADLTNEQTHFYIDSYQRGYRWTDEQVKELLLDIYEFSQKHSGNNDLFYCLQPIIVTYTPELNAWKVIDGQQRLTTLYLLLSYLKGLQPYNPAPYSISYNKKERLTVCLNEISEHAQKKTWSSEIYKDMKTSYGDDIDCYYVIEAFNTIDSSLERLRPDVDATQLQNFVNLNTCVINKTKVIWYDFQAKTLEDETSSFRKVNMGKIPLTNAELIKALLLREDTDDSENLKNYKKNLAVFWDSIEQQLSDDRFWFFLTNAYKDEYPNRIDFIFDVISEIINEEWRTNADPDDDRFIVNRLMNKNYFSFHVFYRRIEQIGNDSYVQEIWNEVEEYFRMFKDWYQNKRWYHIIGYLVCAANDRYLETVCSISKLYRGHKEGKKSSFVDELTKKIASSIRRDGKRYLPISTVDDLQTYLSTDFTYPQKAKDVERVLLLYNIASTDAIKNEYSRFPFYAYKGDEIKWSIENINPQREDKPKNESERLEWLTKLYESIDEIVPNQNGNKADVDKLKADIKAAKKRIDKGQQVEADDFSTLYEKVVDLLDEDQGTDHTIRNLVLLDRGTNSCFSNSIFPVKRRLLIDAYKTSDVFIPVCTRNVFFKAFPESKELLKWSQNDKSDYFNSIIETISHYLNLQEAVTDEQ